MAGTPGATDRKAGPAALVGNRWALVGGVVYLLEWVAILGASVAGLGPVVSRGLSPEQLVISYQGNVDATATMAGWFAVVLLGRVLVFVGLRRALVDSRRGHPLLDLAVVAAAVSVTLEVASYGLAMAAAERLGAGDRTGMQVLDGAGAGLNLMIGGGLGVAIVCAAWAMTRSGLFSRPLNLLGWVCGLALVLAQLSVAPSMDTFFKIFFIPIVFWVWMLWAGAVLWRASPSRPAAASPGAARVVG